MGTALHYLVATLTTQDARKCSFLPLAIGCRVANSFRRLRLWDFSFLCFRFRKLSRIKDRDICLREHYKHYKLHYNLPKICEIFATYTKHKITFYGYSLGVLCAFEVIYFVIVSWFHFRFVESFVLVFAMLSR